MKDTWINRLMQRWHLRNPWEVIVVLVVFACTGITVFLVKKPLLSVLTGSQETTAVGSILYYIFILPLYNALLLCYGFIFGRFNFFWNFEKRFFKRIFSNFRNHNND